MSNIAKALQIADDIAYKMAHVKGRRRRLQEITEAEWASIILATVYRRACRMTAALIEEQNRIQVKGQEHED